MSRFKLSTKWKPDGDQPKAIEALVAGLEKGLMKQTLLGVTGSGKTFTAANVIERVQKPTLVIAHNKTLAAQLAQEYREFFPDNAVHYFVSYYDFYQPEAYMPVTDTYIEKDAAINEEIDRLRHASTQALLSRRDVIIVASVSCIYGLGSPEEYEKEHFKIAVGDKTEKNDFMRRLIAIRFSRTSADLLPGTFRSIGARVEIMPVSERLVWVVDFEGDKIVNIFKADPVSQRILEKDVKNFYLFPAKHFLTEKNARDRAVKSIQHELKERLKELEEDGKLLEVERLRRRTKYDLAMIKEVGYCSGIENYSRHLSGKLPGEPPDTLLSYFPKKKDGSADFLLVVDESHVTLPQLGGMYEGDHSRKKTLVEHGFRLPSAMDNRPLKYHEFEKRVGQTIYTSATPGEQELRESEQVVEQIIRPTGLVDPGVTVRPIQEKGDYKGQVQDFIAEAEKEIKTGGRVMVTTLTKRMSEDLSVYLKEAGVKSEYLHSDIKTIERIKILTNFRRGEFDCLVGVNLLREGLDLPEVSFIGILDADKEGFLRSEVSLIQTIGRAARNSAGRVILYADVVTGSIERALKETNRRREIQIAYNKKHGITPQTIKKRIKDITEELEGEHKRAAAVMFGIDEKLFEANPKKLIREKEEAMEEAVKGLDFETAAVLRDELKVLRARLTKKG
ncbi:excinuclease ABC subunit UvrB [Candidatus Parcubacteria bacterium]|nr:excinuclease ABC subunit UvrB [Candidatus Parcubacteria bacterium]